MGHSRLKARREFPGASHYRDRHGKRRWRYQEKGFSAQLGTDYSSDEFVRRYEAAQKGRRVKDGVKGREVKPGTMNDLIAKFCATPQYRGLGSKSKRNYTYIIEPFQRDHGHRLVKDLLRRHIVDIMAKNADKPSNANSFLTFMRQLMDLAVLHEMRTDNPAHGIKTYPRKNPQGIHTWTEDEITKYYETHKLGTNAYLAMTLMLWTAAAVGDASRMGWDNVVDGCIQYRRKKTSKKVNRLIKIPIAPDLQEALDLVPKDQKVFMWAQGMCPYRPEGLGKAVRKWCDAAGLPQCTSHGLRKTCATRLADSLASPHEIQAVTGHSNLAMVTHYTIAADTKSLASSGMAKVLTRSEREEIIANHK